MSQDYNLMAMRLRVQPRLSLPWVPVEILPSISMSLFVAYMGQNYHKAKISNIKNTVFYIVKHCVTMELILLQGSQHFKRIWFQTNFQCSIIFCVG